MVAEAIDFIKRLYPKVDIGKLGPIRFGYKKGNVGKIVSVGRRINSEYGIFKQDGSQIGTKLLLGQGLNMLSLKKTLL